MKNESNINLTTNTIEELKSIFRSLPKKKITLENIIIKLKDEIKSLLSNKNYTIQDICDILFKHKNISIKPSTLSAYLKKNETNTITKDLLSKNETSLNGGKNEQN